METKEILSTGEVSELTSVPIATLRFWRHCGTGPVSFKLGPRKVAYRRADVETWLAEQYATATGGA